MKTVVSFIAACTVVLTAAAASAQEVRPGRPYRGLFASGSEGVGHLLTATGAVGAGYITNSIVDWTGDPDAPEKGEARTGNSSFNSLSGGLSYASTSEKLALGASLSAAGRHYPGFDGLITTSYAGSAGASISLSRRTTFGVNQTVAHLPWRVLILAPDLAQSALGQVVAPNLDFATTRSDSYVYTTGSEITHQLSRKGSLTGSYSYQWTDTVGDHRNIFGETTSVRVRRGSSDASGSLGDRPVTEFQSGPELRSQTAALIYSYAMTRGLGLRLGYRYAQAKFGDLTPYRSHVIDSGLEYSHSLSLSRKTALSFSSGATAVTRGESINFGIVGNASLTHEIARSWSAAASYVRNVAFSESILVPFFYDSVNAGIGGLLNRRISLQAGAGGTIGNLSAISESTDDQTFDTFYGAAGIGVAISRHLSVNADYIYYAYSFNLPEFLGDGLSQRLGRQGVRLTLNAWAPIFERGRRPNATR